jgi:hypothetical protein
MEFLVGFVRLDTPGYEAFGSLQISSGAHNLIQALDKKSISQLHPSLRYENNSPW